MKLENIKKGVVESSDWAGDISNTEKLLVKVGLKDIEEGNTFAHEQVMKQINEAYDL
ncbi:hypothetical protein [Tenacibaculum sp. 190524A02b]|uniref:hypothetical protein n=1 Tax=Tenacibaculum vairaonense TaxID=3137860 RepID=UPI0031FBA1B1